jgi:hypothetical protein
MPRALYYDWEGRPIDRETWSRLFEDERHIGADDLDDGVMVSTVWLGISTSLSDPPLIFETMVFGGPFNERTWRWATEAEARAGHREIVETVRLELLLEQ